DLVVSVQVGREQAEVPREVGVPRRDRVDNRVEAGHRGNGRLAGNRRLGRPDGLAGERRPTVLRARNQYRVGGNRAVVATGVDEGATKAAVQGQSLADGQAAVQEQARVNGAGLGDGLVLGQERVGGSNARGDRRQGQDANVLVEAQADDVEVGA